MPLSNLAKSRIGHAGPLGYLPPSALPDAQHFDDYGVDRLVHGRNYPHTDIGVNPHMDTASPDNCSMAKVREIVAKNVSARMKAGPLKTQKLLSERAGISQSHVSRIENGASGITIDRLELVAGALGCEPYELLLDDEQARRALIERLMRAPAVPDERVEQSGFVPMPNKQDEGGNDAEGDQPQRKPLKRFGEGIGQPGNLRAVKGKKK